MKKIVSILVVVFCVAQATNAQKNVLTQIITYKVNLKFDKDLAGESFKDPYFVYGRLAENWYTNQLAPADYQTFVLQVHRAAVTGKIKVHDSFFGMDGYRPVFHKLLANEVAGSDTIQKTMQRPYPPYDDYDGKMDIKPENDGNQKANHRLCVLA